MIVVVLVPPNLILPSQDSTPFFCVPSLSTSSSLSSASPSLSNDMFFRAWQYSSGRVFAIPQFYHLPLSVASVLLQFGNENEVGRFQCCKILELRVL